MTCCANYGAQSQLLYLDVELWFDDFSSVAPHDRHRSFHHAKRR
jgi:hypothetical protein